MRRNLHRKVQVALALLTLVQVIIWKKTVLVGRRRPVPVVDDDDLNNLAGSSRGPSHGPHKHGNVSMHVSDANIQQEQKFQVLTPNNNTSTSAPEPCALLFFGLVVEFKSTVLPSIQKNIIGPNQHCDIFLHTYNLTHVPKNPRGRESGKSTTNVEDAYLLLAKYGGDVNADDHIVMESLDSFYRQRAEDINRTRQNYHTLWETFCCISHDNMIKQWNSIEGAWDLMRAHEKRMLSGGLTSDTTIGKNDNAHDNTYYKYVGLFRSDVFFMTPIEVSSGAKAIVPKFNSAYGYNDRMFVGTYEWAKVWAAKRFDFIPEFEETYMLKPGDMPPVDGFHSEFFLKTLLDHYKVPVVRDTTICFMRIRTGPRILQNDCGEYPEFATVKKMAKYLPENITLGVQGWDGEQNIGWGS